MSDDKLYDAIRRGEQAKALLENELLWECFATLDTNYMNGWRQTAARDSMTREKLWIAINILPKVREHLVKVLNDGKLSQADLTMRQQKQQRAA